MTDLTEQLRKGNLLRVDNDFLPISGIKFDKIYFKEVIWSIENAHPIPFNEAWAKMFYFQPEGTEAGDDGAMELGNMNMEEKITFMWVPRVGNYTEKDALGLWVARDYGNQQFLIDLKRVKYVHQFQNIYFDLIGKEAKYKILQPNGNQ